MKLVMIVKQKEIHGFEHVISVKSIIPIEYKSAKQALEDFKLQFDNWSAFDFFGVRFEFDDYFDYHNDLKEELLPEFLTLEEWFDRFKGKDLIDEQTLVYVNNPKFA